MPHGLDINWSIKFPGGMAFSTDINNLVLAITLERIEELYYG